MSSRRRARAPAWSIPAWYAGTALLAGFFLPRLESRLGLPLNAGVEPASLLAMFSSISSGMIALTGIVFSLAFVMVQFSATAYSPRLVLWIARDPLLWHAVGVFSATFLYSLAATAWVQHQRTHGGVPFFSAWLVVALLVVSVAVFIALIEKLSLLQVHRMLAFTSKHARQVIEQTYPGIETPPTAVDAALFEKLTLTQTLVHEGPPQSLQALDSSALSQLADACGGIIEVRATVGDTLVLGTEMLRVHGGARIDEAKLRDAFALGSERTFEQDPKYAIRLIVDIAIRALSPAVNDPTTAVQALDHLEDLLLRLGRRRLEIGAVRDARGELRLIVTYPAWDDFLALAFDEIRYYGKDSVQVMRRMRAFAADLVIALPPERHASLRRQQERLDATIARAFPDAAERQDASVEDRQGFGVPRKVAR
jgi:uncharacterized membrane protein